MSDHEIQEKDAAIEVARRIAEEEGIGRRPQGLSKYIIPTIAVLWSSFQLSIASWLILDNDLFLNLGDKKTVGKRDHPDLQSGLRR